MTATKRTRSVLIVEDVDSMRELLELTIEKIEGFSVSGSARNGIEARFELTRRFPDLVLLDEVLPGESSLDLLSELKNLSVPVVLLTGIEDRDEALPPGAIERLTKPGWKTLDQDRERIGVILKGLFALDGCDRD